MVSGQLLLATCCAIDLCGWIDRIALLDTRVLARPVATYTRTVSLHIGRHESKLRHRLPRGAKMCRACPLAHVQLSLRLWDGNFCGLATFF